MKVRLLEIMCGPAGHVDKGAVVDLPDEQGRELVAAGYAEPVGRQEPKAPERAVAPTAVETAVAPPADEIAVTAPSETASHEPDPVDEDPEGEAELTQEAVDQPRRRRRRREA